MNTLGGQEGNGTTAPLHEGIDAVRTESGDRNPGSGSCPPEEYSKRNPCGFLEDESGVSKGSPSREKKESRPKIQVPIWGGDGDPKIRSRPPTPYPIRRQLRSPLPKSRLSRVFPTTPPSHKRGSNCSFNQQSPLRSNL